MLGGLAPGCREDGVADGRVAAVGLEAGAAGEGAVEAAEEGSGPGGRIVTTPDAVAAGTVEHGGRHAAPP
jgi:hypothetical protein